MNHGLQEFFVMESVSISAIRGGIFGFRFVPNRLSRFIRARVFKRDRENERNDHGKGARNHPNRGPILHAVRGSIGFHNLPGEPRTQTDADAVRDQRDEALRARADVARRFLVDINLAGDEEEIITDAV